MLLGAGGSLCQTDPIDGAGGGVIAFVSNRNGTEEIYIMNADGGGQTRVTNNSAFEFDVCWSPDGSRLAFCSTLEGGFEIYVMDVIDISTATFGPPVRLTSDPAITMSPTWSPDGTRIAYASGGIKIMDADGSNVISVDTSPVTGNQPAWSPVGDSLVFVGSGGATQGIFVIGTDGSNLRQVTTGYHLTPTWSLDASQIAYVADLAMEDIFIVNEDGTGNHCITTNPENDFDPDWSPDGMRLVYEGSVSGNDEICIMNIDGTGYVRLTNQGTNRGPSWYDCAGGASVDDSPRATRSAGIRLHQNYPNPFDLTTVICYYLPADAFVSLKVHNALGQEMRTLLDSRESSGYQSVTWDGRTDFGHRVSPGVYFYRIEAGGEVDTKSMLLLK